MIVFYGYGLGNYMFQLDMAAEEKGSMDLHYVLPGSLALVNYDGEVSLCSVELKVAPQSDCILYDDNRGVSTRGSNAPELTEHYIKLASWAYLALNTV